MLDAINLTGDRWITLEDLAVLRLRTSWRAPVATATARVQNVMRRSRLEIYLARFPVAQGATDSPTSSNVLM